LLQLWFDDGYESTFLVAYPVMKKMDLTGIVGVVTDVVGKFTRLGRRSPTRFMTKEQLSTLIDDGWEIASHSVTHPFRFDLLTTEETVYELEESKRWIEEKMGVVPSKFVVPRHLIREEQMKLVMKYYSYIRPLGNPIKGQNIFHWINGRREFERRLGYEPT